jgi:hypothetical protein
MSQEKEVDETGVFMLGNLDREVKNPVEDDGTPIYYTDPITELDAAIQTAQSGGKVVVQSTKGKPWTLRRIILTAFYAHGQIEDVDELESMSLIRRRMQAAKGQMRVNGGEIKFIRKVANKLTSVKKLPIACWELLEEELKLAVTMPAAVEPKE